MCLTLRILAPIGVAEDLRTAVADVSSPSLLFEPVRPGHGKRGSRKGPRQPEVVAPCLCWLLSDEADWSAATWAMRLEEREVFGDALEAIARALPGAEIELLWVGDTAERAQEVTAAQLGTLARASAVGTKVRYRIVTASTS